MTDTPRLLCLKEDPIEGARSGRIRIKSEVIFEPNLPNFITDSEIKKAEVVASAETPSTSTPAKSIFPRSRTISGVRSGAAINASEALSNLLRGVEGKGDRAFVIQTVSYQYFSHLR